MVQLLHTERDHAETTFDLTNNTLMEHLQKGFQAVATHRHRWRLGWWIHNIVTCVVPMLHVHMHKLRL
jgi:hypothetical protein